MGDQLSQIQCPRGHQSDHFLPTVSVALRSYDRQVLQYKLIQVEMIDCMLVDTIEQYAAARPYNLERMPCAVRVPAQSTTTSNSHFPRSRFPELITRATLGCGQINIGDSDSLRSIQPAFQPVAKTI